MSRTTEVLGRLAEHAHAVLDRFEGRTRGEPSAEVLARRLRKAIADARELVRTAEKERR